MSAYYPGQNSLSTRRLGAFAAIILVHVLVIWAFISGLATSGAKYVQTILQTNIIETQKPKDLPPPPPPVELKEHPPVQVIAPDISINIPVEPPPIVVQKAAPPPPPPAPKAAPPPPPTKIAVTYKPDINDFYPDAARRANQEGRAVVKLCISEAGKIDSAEIATSSGFPMLDDAAIKVSKAMRFKPPTQLGKPVAVCTDLPVKFELHSS